MRDDFRVGLGNERVTLLLQFALEIEIVLDNAVVDDDDLARAVAVRVRVLFSGTAVRRPPRVADAILARQRIQRDDVLELRELAGAAAELDGAVMDDGDACRVVAAVFETAKAVDENGN